MNRPIPQSRDFLRQFGGPLLRRRLLGRLLFLVRHHRRELLLRVIARGLRGSTCSMKSAKVPDQFAARCCWVKATRLFTKSPWRSVSSVRFDMLPLHERCLRLLYSKGVPGLPTRAPKALDICKNRLLLLHPKRYFRRFRCQYGSSFYCLLDSPQ